MRTLLLIYLVTFPLFVNAQQADTLGWCPAGATWTYELLTAIGKDYYQLEYLGDTIIQGETAKVLQSSTIHTIQNPGFPVSRTATLGDRHYFKYENDSVFAFYNSGFQFMYDFSANTSASWPIAGDSTVACTQNSIPYVDTTTVLAKDSFATTNLIFERFRLDTSTYWTHGTYILKNIGSMQHSFPIIAYDSCYGIDGRIGQTQQLVCYYDSLRGYIFEGSGLPLDCHSLMTSVEAPQALSLPSWIAYPNPSSGMVRISGLTGRASYMLSNVAGQRLAAGTLLDSELNVSALPAGLYFLEIRQAGQVQVFKIRKE